MSGNFMRQKNNATTLLVSDVVFEGALLSDTRAALVIELFQYIFYMRQQIPLPVDQLTLCAKHSTKEQEVPKSAFNRPTAQKAKDRKSATFLKDWSQLSDNIKKSFRMCPEIDQVTMHVGGTVVTPKESYVVQLPPPCPDADYLSFKKCKSTLFKQIVSEDTLGTLKSDLSPSNITLLLSAPRTCPLNWFLPKHSITPKSGSVISFNFRCVYFVPISYDLSITDCNTSEISGLEVLECSLCENEPLCHCKLNNNSHESVEDTNHRDEDGLQRCSCKNVQASSPQKLSRFCEHQRLNYIYSCKKRAINDSSSSGNRSEEISNDSMELMQHEESIITDLADPCERDTSDYIWYQSPVVLKGFTM